MKNAPETVTNLAVLCGTLTTDPTSRELANGTIVVQFDVSTRIGPVEGGTDVSVPMSWTDPAASALTPLSRGTDVVVIGTVRRRFFRSGGTTQSRTEVVIDKAVPTSRVKTVRSLLAAAAASLVE